ncbi:hypothetical protein JCM30566_02370 [Marinitoga arctica]
MWGILFFLLYTILNTGGSKYVEKNINPKISFNINIKKPEVKVAIIKYFKLVNLYVKIKGIRLKNAINTPASGIIICEVNKSTVITLNIAENVIFFTT